MGPKHYIIAAGGTGGHVFPALALAAELRARGAVVTFFTDARGNRYLSKDTAEQSTLRTVVLPLTPPTGGRLQRLWASFSFLKSVMPVRRWLKQYPAHGMIGFGGYPVVPVVLAARLKTLPIVLHEQNALMGKTNRWAARSAKIIALTFPETAGLPKTTKTEVIHTGLPLRPIEDITPYQAPQAQGPLQLLVLGGSQGSRAFSEIIPQAVAQLPEALQQRLVITQQCRPQELESVEDLYSTLPLASYELAPFFDDCLTRLQQAHLIISRSGAGSLAEIMALGRPSLLIPYPHAAEDHQTANAKAASTQNAAWLRQEADLTPALLSAFLQETLQQPEALQARAQAAKTLGQVHREAASRLADIIESKTPCEQPSP